MEELQNGSTSFATFPLVPRAAICPYSVVLGRILTGALGICTYGEAGQDGFQQN
jgi:hypothetical protein